MLGLKGNMREYLINSKTLNKNKNEIKFNDIVEEIAKFASLNQM
jgi:DNA-directed RNA polymerase delta subunit